MVQITTFLAASLIISSTCAVPLRFTKRIAQVITEATADWEQACLRAGGAQKCNPLSQKAFMALLAAPGNCEQQDAGDEMVTLAKSLGNDAEMIRLAQLYVQQPRNAPNSLEVPYCQVAPKNSELNGLFHCQFAGSKFGTFSGDQTGNLPLGLSAVSPPGSCPANPNGPVPDGQQLNKIVKAPRAGNATPPPAAPANNSGATPPAQAPPVQAPPAKPSTPAPAPATGGVDKGFRTQNGIDAKKLNDQFSKLTPNSPCQAGQNACVNGGFAQCVNGKFAITQCAGGLQCFALPLVNSAGTSITCTTTADKNARIAATGA